MNSKKLKALLENKVSGVPLPREFTKEGKKNNGPRNDVRKSEGQDDEKFTNYSNSRSPFDYTKYPALFLFIPWDYPFPQFPRNPKLSARIFSESLTKQYREILRNPSLSVSTKRTATDRFAEAAFFGSIGVDKYEYSSRIFNAPSNFDPWIFCLSCGEQDVSDISGNKPYAPIPFCVRCTNSNLLSNYNLLERLLTLRKFVAYSLDYILPKHSNNMEQS